ncbi:growth arrest and DNA damage-inducible protein GADD45 alpha-like isoform X2 [Acanthaster planci]|uniref:Growth arrest and DNA damage-inducible protein GADD45 alpha-like isoform X2 n=1 Tax=Acanthaster planci TaxID=133434 RepID=A0A8B7ZD61_ACAPL|nr:growth arrest and DNA damage-inducible protein GADD45 alpha-like isoform X2 [Acanthaster planci]
MTFEEEFDVSFKASRNCTNNMISMDARMALRELLLSAKVEGRITYGVYPSVRKLGSEPNKVMLCIHADNNADEDVALHIHFTLMEAFCREHHIRLLKFPKEIDATTGCFLEHYHVMAKEMPFPHISVAS